MQLKKYIPDTLTSLNALCGTLGVVFAGQGRIEAAFPLMLAASLFDFCDGLAARLLGAYSDLGKELDSISDMISFGVLPSVMLFNLMTCCTWSDGVLCYVPVLVAVFSAVRLAKFNVDKRQGKSFLGLPTPASAMVCGSLSYFVAYEPGSLLSAMCGTMWFIPVLSVVLAALLVCEIPMFSIKFSKDDDTKLKTKRIALLVLALAAVVVVVLAGLNWSLIVFLIFTVYILKNIIYWIFAL